MPGGQKAGGTGNHQRVLQENFGTTQASIVCFWNLERLVKIAFRLMILR
jgi:hypothetical protein